VVGVADSAFFTDRWFGYKNVHNHVAVDNFRLYGVKR